MRKFESVDAELETLLHHAPTYRMLVEPGNAGPLAKLARNLSVFDVSTAYPLIFVIEASNASEKEKGLLYDLILSYVVRRTLCGLTGKNYNNVFLRITSQLQTNGVSGASFTHAFSSSDGDAVRFPNDAELCTNILERKQYGNIQQSRLRHILCDLERAARDKFDENPGLPDDLTIEHVLPDTWMEYWPLPDGVKAPADLRAGMTESQLKLIEDRETLKHTLGNLTLLTDARNPSLGNSGFDTKREALRKSLLKLNHEIADVSDWTEKAIQARATRLAALACKIWPRGTD